MSETRSNARSTELVTQVSDLGEAGLLALVQKFCPPEVVGDDAAVCAVRDGYALVVTADMLVDEVHFSDRTTSGYDAGWRAMAANLSDIAAMAATPIGVTMSLGLPPTAPTAWVEALYRGAVDCLRVGGCDVPIVGGDVCSSVVRTVSVSAFGEVKPGCEMRRAAARAGDAIVVTGAHGLSRLGLALLLEPDREDLSAIAAADRERAIAAHQRPRPRLDWVAALQDWQERGAAIAGMDSSDGLADAIGQICRASGVGARLRLEPLAELADLADLATMGVPETLALEWTLYGGEDFELVLCAPPEVARGLAAGGGAIVGEVTAARDVVVASPSGTIARIDRGREFQHFSRALRDG